MLCYFAFCVCHQKQEKTVSLFSILMFFSSMGLWQAFISVELPFF